MTRLGLLLALLAAPAASATEADVVAAAEAAVADVWPDAEVRVVRLSGGAEAAPPPLRVRFRDAAPRGRVSAEVEAQEPDGTWAPAGWAYLEVAVFETAPVLITDVDRGEPVAGAVRLDRVETTRLSAVLPADALGAGWTAARSLRAGTVLTGRLVEAPAAAETGDALRVRYARGAVAVTLDCEARERGALGETVRAVCAATGATYRVQLTAPGEGDWTATL
ncbi:flagella basal body P-ring formation protein FlgA [Rubrivirga marina]|uniref:Flagella basal body P-ring formation protein FlgA SAF domain-containing protein n=1 Tax=Rubrivirga marina TaxID=1196024 RepID=A0A271IXH6_9BACT|nr:flagella basal body P-ring formation protein FlgA [Rubrivirga marina]PAP75787.1 hypothetical protein BSZ37_04690 [Rubrivirga marina]